MLSLSIYGQWTSINSYYEKNVATGAVRCIDDEIPFDIPQGWEWERWGNISLSIQYGYNAPALEKGDIRMVRISDIQNGKVIWSKVPYCSIDSSDVNSYLLKPKDILFARTGGTVGKSFLVEEVPYESIYAGYLIRTQYSDELEPHYLKSFMESSLYWEQLKAGTVATAQPNCNGKTLGQMLIPIPPKSEQKRIIDKVVSVLPFLEKYEDLCEAFEHINEEIFHALKKSILQDAIQGKLVPQMESEGTAEDLLTEIRDEKQRLVKEGKLKKSALANESRIFRGDDNRYYEQIGSETVQIECEYDYPTSWSIVRLSSVCSLLDGDKREKQYIYMDARYLRGKSSGEYLSNGRFVSKGQSIILVDGENSGEVFIVPHDGYMGSTFKQLWISNKLHIPYILNVIGFYKDLFRQSKKGAAIPHLNKDVFNNLLIGLPPLNEQVRIVKQIGRLFDTLE